MAWTLVDSDTAAFADGDSSNPNGGHVFNLGSAPQVGDIDVLFVNSDTIVTTPSGWTRPTGASQVANQGAYGYYRIASGGETDQVLITTSGNFNAVAGWSRWSGNGTFEVAVGAQINGTTGATTPSIDTGTLTTTGELVVVAALLHRLASPEPTTPVWSTGYTGLTEVTQGTGNPGCTQFVGYKTNAGTAAETPSCTWTNGAFDRYAIAMTFAPNQDQNLSGTDSATLTDSAALTATLTASDMATVSDSSQLNAAASGTDTVTLADQSALTAAVAAPDSATLAESADVVATTTAADSATFSDTADLSYAPDVSDGATLGETAALTVALQATDAATLTDTSQISQALIDSATLTDTSALATAIPGSDTLTFAESATLTVTLTAADLATLTETAFAAEQGIDIHVSAGAPTRTWSAGAPWI